MAIGKRSRTTKKQKRPTLWNTVSVATPPIWSAGTTPLTNHQLRHLFATRCIECGVDIKTVAEWLRHKDGGALALKRYSHVRNEHSVEMAAKVHF